MKQEIKVLVVDDSAFMRHLIKDILDSTSNIKVIDFASNGSAALKKIKALKPDVVTLDIEMPILDGLKTLERINKECPTPTIILSNLTRKSTDTTIKALMQLGAIDFLQKPVGVIKGEDIERIQTEIVEKIKLAVDVKSNPTKIEKTTIEVIKTNNLLRNTKARVVVIGASTGGPKALEIIVRFFPEDFPVPILIVQHMPPKFTTSLAHRLNSYSLLKIKEARDGDQLEPGFGFLAPGDYHMILDKNNTIKLNKDPPVCGVRPSIDKTLFSVNEVYEGKILGVILTGMGHDGTEGIEKIKEKGGMCIAEDKSTCTVYGMPRSVIEANLADSVVPLQDIVPEIFNILSKWR